MGVDTLDIADRINRLREAAGMTANQLAKAAGVGQASLSDILNRKNKPSLDTLERLCSVFGITLSEFFAEDHHDEMPPEVRRLCDKVNRLSPEQREAILRLIEAFTPTRKES